MSVAFRFCSVILDEDPEIIQSVQCLCVHSLTYKMDILLLDQTLSCSFFLTSWELQASVDGHPGSFCPRDVHGELQASGVRVDAICEGEAHFVGASAHSFGRVNQQLVQDVLVGEGRPLREDPAVLQRLGVELSSAEFP